ncbi:ABC transporter B family member 21 [Dichanthelium oligosanthes]|uniref:ABC transporter B family member 21 n=1 Tax=Dichanthelium oligosanthes TaxID=888268 RepID=A0A1E5WLC7_9POAL|nr:ABC transporter B family member 21 [Dichanthelium oligosanthes]
MTGERQATRIRSLYIKSVLRQDIAFFDLELTAGQVISCASADTVLIQGAIGDKVGKFAQLVTTFLGGLTVAFVKGWLLTLVMLSTVPLFIAAGGIVSRMHSKISGEGQKSYSAAGDIVEQTVGSIRTVVSFNGEKEAVSRYNNQIKKAYKATVREGAAQGFGAGSLSFIYFSTFGLVIWYGTKLIQSRGYSGGNIISILFAVMVGDATPCLSSFTDGRAAAHRLFKTIKRRPEIDSDDAAGIVLEDIKGDVDLKDVYFSYPSRPEQLIFDGLSLQVASGKIMALVGESGSGKSTVINLVERFYDPQAGEVCIDGINIKLFKLDWIRQKIGLVSQEPLLFTTSIKQNISYRKEDATLEEVKRAAELASAATFIDNLPNIYTFTGHHDELMKDPNGAYSQLIRMQKAHQEDGYQVDGKISHSRPIRILSLRQSTSNHTGSISQRTMTPPASLTVFTESIKSNDANSDMRNDDGKTLTGGKLIERVRALAFRSIVHQEVAWFDDSINSSGALGGRLCIDALNLRRLVGDNLAVIIQCTVSLLSGILIAMISDWKVSMVIMVVIPLIGLQGYAQVKFLKGFNQDAKKRVVTVYNNKCQASRTQGIRTGIVGGLGFGFSNMMVYTSSALCYFVAAQFISHGTSTFPSVFKAFLSLILAMIGLSEASTLASDTKKAKDAATSIFSIIDKKSKIDSGTGEGLTLDPANGDIDFNHIRFKYPCRLDIQVFSDFTLNIPSGKNAALVGPSGSGKSTVIALLERFYDPDSGTISLDGVDIKNLKISWLRNKMGLLSGGQKQRLAIARAILKDPRILLLDEATSALDAESERVVQDTLNQATVGRTTITVAHRLSTIQGADMIAVLKDGMIVEKGTHEALMGIKGGVYASLVELRSGTA